MIADLRDYGVEEILRDGRSMHVRAIRPDDRERLVDHFHRLSARSVHFRFMGMKRELSEADLDYFTLPDFVRHIALAATLREGGAERIIGIGRYVADDQDAAAEVAFAVADQYQGRGIGTLLLEHLLRIARERGITEFRADVLGDNNQMLDVFRNSRLQVGRATDASVIHLSFPTAETEESRRRMVQGFERQVGRLADAAGNRLGPSHLEVPELTARVHQLERRLEQLERELRDTREQQGS